MFELGPLSTDSGPSPAARNAALASSRLTATLPFGPCDGAPFLGAGCDRFPVPRTQKLGSADLSYASHATCLGPVEAGAWMVRSGYKATEFAQMVW